MVKSKIRMYNTPPVYMAIPYNLINFRHLRTPQLHFCTHYYKAMELYLVPNDPVNTTLVSSDGILRYWVRTTRPLSSLRTCSSIIQRPSARESYEQETLGEIIWGGLGRRSVVHSDLFKGRASVAGSNTVRVKDLLWKINPFGT
jgi:hypothetical protein